VSPVSREIPSDHAVSPRPRAERARTSPPRDASEPRIQAGDFKARCLELMDRVAEAGVEYTITKRGRPVAKLVPCEDAPAEAFGFLAGTVVDQADVVSPDPAAWEEADAPAPPAERKDRSAAHGRRSRQRRARRRG